MKLSRYTHLFNDGEHYYMFNAETIFISEIDKDLFFCLHDRDFDRIPESTAARLMEKRIIVDDSSRDLYFLNSKTQSLRKSYDTRTLSLIIAPTTGCNFACPYCFEPKKNPKTMTREVEDRIIEYVRSRTLAENISLTWYGGEPLLAFDIIERLYDRIIAETEKKIISHGIITNGFLIDNLVISFFKISGLDNIQISFDGTKDRHDRSRFLKDGNRPTFDIIRANLEKLAADIPDLKIQARINVNRNNIGDFAEMFKLFSDPFRFKNVHVYPGIIREESADGVSMCGRCYSERDLPELYELIEKEGIPVNYLPRIPGKGCMAHSADAFIIGPEGELYKCWEDVSKPNRVVGSIMDGKRGDYGLMMRYMHDCDVFDDKCRKCRVFPICWGGCAYRRYRNMFEEGEFEICSPLRNPELLKRVMLDFIRSGRPESEKFVSMF